MNAQELWKYSYLAYTDTFNGVRVRNKHYKMMGRLRLAALLERKLAAAQRTIEAQAASVEHACSCADVSSADKLRDWIVGAQSELAGNARRIEELEAGYLEATERVLYLCDKIDKHNATMIERMSRFERIAPVDWRGYEADETPLGIALDGGGDEVEM